MASAFKSYWLGAWRTATKISLRHSGAWVEVLRIQAWKTDGSPPVSGWREVYKKAGTSPPPPPTPTPTPPPPPPPVVLTVTITPSSVGGRSSVGGPSVATHTVTAAATGGTGPYSYHWELLSWTAATPPEASSPDAATTFFTQGGMGDEESDSAQFRVTAVDTLSNFGSATIDVSFVTFVSDGGGRGGGFL